MTQSTPSQLRGAFAKVERARVHIEDFEREIDQFSDDQFDAFDIRCKPDKENYVLTLPPIDSLEIPDTARSIIGESANSMRSALDYLVYELAKKNQGKEIKRTQFPVFDDLQTFRKKSATYLQGLRQNQVDRIEKLQPYNNVIWTRFLVELSNLDKHRHLVSVTQSGGVNRIVLSQKEAVDSIAPQKTVKNIDGTDHHLLIYGNRINVSIGGFPAVEFLRLILANVRHTLRSFRGDF